MTSVTATVTQLGQYIGRLAFNTDDAGGDLNQSHRAGAELANSGSAITAEEIELIKHGVVVALNRHEGQAGAQREILQTLEQLPHVRWLMDPGSAKKLAQITGAKEAATGFRQWVQGLVAATHNEAFSRRAAEAAQKIAVHSATESFQLRIPQFYVDKAAGRGGFGPGLVTAGSRPALIGPASYSLELSALEGPFEVAAKNKKAVESIAREAGQDPEIILATFEEILTAMGGVDASAGARGVLRAIAKARQLGVGTIPTLGTTFAELRRALTNEDITEAGRIAFENFHTVITVAQHLRRPAKTVGVAFVERNQKTNRWKTTRELFSRVAQSAPCPAQAMTKLIAQYEAVATHLGKPATPEMHAALAKLGNVGIAALKSLAKTPPQNQPVTKMLLLMANLSQAYNLTPKQMWEAHQQVAKLDVTAYNIAMVLDYACQASSKSEWTFQQVINKYAATYRASEGSTEEALAKTNEKLEIKGVMPTGFGRVDESKASSLSELPRPLAGLEPERYVGITRLDAENVATHVMELIDGGWETQGAFAEFAIRNNMKADDVVALWMQLGHVSKKIKKIRGSDRHAPAAFLAGREMGLDDESIIDHVNNLRSEDVLSGTLSASFWCEMSIKHRLSVTEIKAMQEAARGIYSGEMMMSGIRAALRNGKRAPEEYRRVLGLAKGLWSKLPFQSHEAASFFGDLVDQNMDIDDIPAIEALAYKIREEVGLCEHYQVLIMGEAIRRGLTADTVDGLITFANRMLEIPAKSIRFGDGRAAILTEALRSGYTFDDADHIIDIARAVHGGIEGGDMVEHLWTRTILRNGWDTNLDEAIALGNKVIDGVMPHGNFDEDIIHVIRAVVDTLYN